MSLMISYCYCGVLLQNAWNCVSNVLTAIEILPVALVCVHAYVHVYVYMIIHYFYCFYQRCFQHS